MRSIIVFLSWLVILVHARDIIRPENPPRYVRLLKDKRGISDHPLAFPSHGSPSFAATSVHPSLSSGYNLGGSSGFSLGHAGLHSFGGGSSGHGIGYSLPSSGYTSGLASGYVSPALGSHHGSLGALQGISLGGHSAQSTYSVPNLGGGLFSPSSSLGSSKTGPVTFGIHGGTSPATSSSFVSAGPGLSAYGNGGPSLSVMLASHGGLLSSSSPSHSVSGGLVFAPTRSGSSSSSSSSSGYSLPASSHGSSSSYSLPITSGSSGVHAALSSGSSASSSTYDLPYSSSGSSSYLPPHSDGASSSYSSASASSYSSSPSYAGSSGASYSSPSVVYGGASSGYTPTYASSGSSSPQYAAESHGVYSSVSPRYHLGKSYQDKLSGSAKYDTISYSSPNGKY